VTGGGQAQTVVPIRTGEEYVQSLRGRNLRVYLMGERVEEPVDHPLIRPSINAVAETYDLAVREEGLASAESSISGRRVNRFLHIAESAEDLVLQNKMQRKLGQLTGTCFQRCVGMDALNSLHSTTHEIDEAHGTKYHARLLEFIKRVQEENLVIGRQSCDTRSMEGGEIDAGNAKFAGQEALILLDRVFIPWELVFMDGEHEFAAMLVERFTCYHRRSYVCKTGLGDVMIGAAATVADYNGVPRVSHIKDKLVEMTHLNESIYAAGIASSHQAHRMKSGVWLNDDMLAQVCKHNVTRFPYEIGRLAQDIAGGLVVTLPSERDFRDPETGPLLRKYLAGRKGVDVESRMRILRLIENMTLGRNAVGYLTESMHGAGSPQAQRIQIARQMQLGYKKGLAKSLAGIHDGAEEPPENSE